MACARPFHPAARQTRGPHRASSVRWETRGPHRASSVRRERLATPAGVALGHRRNEPDAALRGLIGVIGELIELCLEVLLAQRAAADRSGPGIPTAQ